MKKITKKIPSIIIGVPLLACIGLFTLWPQQTKDTASNSPTASSSANSNDVADKPATDPDKQATPAAPVRQAVATPASVSTAKQKDAKKVGSIITTSQPEKVQEYAANNGLTINNVTPMPGGTVLVAMAQPPADQAVRSLQSKGLASSVTANHVYRTTYNFSNVDTNYANQWNLTKISAHTAWDYTTGSAESVIAIIDTGVLFSQTINGSTYTQPDFPDSKLWKNTGEIGVTTNEGPAPNCTSRSLPLDKQCNNLDDDGNGKTDDWQGWDFMGGFNGDGAQCPNYRTGRAIDLYEPEDNDPQPYSCDSPYEYSALNKTHYNGTCNFGYSACYIGHGTMVGSVAAAATDNGQLISGIDHNAKVMNLRVLDGYGYTTTDRVAAAVAYAGQNGADVINMSLGVSDCTGDFVDTVLESAMAGAKAAGSVIVAASGNESLNTSICYPASSNHAIAVGATDQNDLRASFSNSGSKLDVVAPGTDIPVANSPSSAIDSNYYPSAAGTSLATPHVAGLAGLLRAIQPSATPDQISKYITQRADIVPAMNGSLFSYHYGFGRINNYTSVRVAEGSSRPVYRLHNAAKNCQLYTSSIDQRRYVEKIDYLHQAIDHWEVIDTSLSYQPTTSTHTCN